MRLRRARTLVVAFSDGGPVVQNFLTRHATPLNGLAFDLLSRANDWHAPEEFYSLYPAVPPAEVAAHLQALTAHGLLVAEGTEPARFDLEYESFWKWDTTAGLYHFGMKDSPYLNPQQAQAWMEYRSATTPAVPLWTTNEKCEVVHQLEKPNLGQGLMEIMNRRRSIRAFLPEPMKMEALRDCLFAGMGITGYLDTHLPEATRKLPLKMTPSGGARNPYEAYVYALNVEGLSPGIYHYSAIDNTLGLVNSKPHCTASDLLVGQYWADQANAIFLLAANFERTMWKYPNPTAYRVLLMEAGHIAQNICLAASDHHLTTTPTAAICDSHAHQLLQLDWIKQSMVLAILVGKAHEEAMEIKNFIPNEQLK